MALTIYSKWRWVCEGEEHHHSWSEVHNFLSQLAVKMDVQLGQLQILREKDPGPTVGNE